MIHPNALLLDNGRGGASIRLFFQRVRAQPSANRVVACVLRPLSSASGIRQVSEGRSKSTSDTDRACTRPFNFPHTRAHTTTILDQNIRCRQQRGGSSTRRPPRTAPIPEARRAGSVRRRRPRKQPQLLNRRPQQQSARTAACTVILDPMCQWWVLAEHRLGVSPLALCLLFFMR